MTGRERMMPLPLSSFMQFENLDCSSPRKRMRMPSFSICSDGATNVTLQEHTVGREQRAAILGEHAGFRGCTIWFTGLSGAGKTTVSFGLEKALTQLGIPCYGLDGDNVRHGLCKNLGFSKEERSENIRRVAEVAKLFADAGMVCLASFISPFRADRNEARQIHEKDGLGFFEIHVDTSLEICESRDPKKLYKKARAGELRGFTGIDSAYEAPEKADFVLHAGTESEQESVNRVLQFLYHNGVLPEKAMQKLIGTPVHELFVRENEKAQVQEELEKTVHSVELSTVDLQWLQVLAEGWATPLRGFMRERQFLQSLHFGQLIDLKHTCLFPGEEEQREGASEYKLENALNQSIPIVLPINQQQKDQLLTADGSSAALCSSIALCHGGRRVALLSAAELFEHRKKERAARQFGCVDERHPGVAQLMGAGDYCLGGDIKVLERINWNDGLDMYRHTPLELRQLLMAKGADAVFVFQLRNPIHNGHALLMRETREMLLKQYRNPVLLLHPLGGWTKDDDVPLHVRMEQHEACIQEGVLGEEWTLLSIFPSPMMYAGPREVQWHARARLAAGVHTYIVGRDPAGIADPDSPSGAPLYEATHGAKVLSMAPGLDHLNIIPFRVAAYDKREGRMAMLDESRKEDFEFISGTRMRNIARKGVNPPPGFMAPKAWEILARYYKSLE